MPHQNIKEKIGIPLFFCFSFSKMEKDEQEGSSIVIDAYEEALTKANLDFTKQYK